MEYIKVTFRFEDPEAFLADVLAATLGEVGFDSFEESGRGLIAYCPMTAFNESTMNTAIAEMPLHIELSYQISTIADQNWNETWEQHYFEPIEIEDRCIIHASNKQLDKSYLYDIIINPKQSFGTGSHETTRMVLRFLMDMDLSGKNVLDMGCGTAVLAIMAEKRGAHAVSAIDIDPWSFRNAQENIQLNTCKNIVVELGDASLLEERSYDLIIANINRNILLNDMNHYASTLSLGGKLLLSGFYQLDLGIINTKAKSLGFEQVSFKEESEWVAVLFEKKH